MGNWPPICRMLTEYVSEWFMLFCTIHKLTVGFAVIGVINGVFIQETFKVAATDDTLMIRQREQQVKVHSRKMQRLFRAADASGDGLLDLPEFQSTMNEPEISSWMASMDLDVEDAACVFEMIDNDGNGRLTTEELVGGIQK